MTKIKPRTAPGVLELLPNQQIAFQNMLATIQATYAKYGFLPVETPVFEHVDVLLTKSGGETEKQVFFVQKTGSLKQGDKPDLALRFDLTVPLARFVAEHEHELAFPFRRYQMQRVYRGERPQRGRQNEFYQCDIDVIGKDTLSPAYDAEIPAIICEVFEALQIGDFTINFSNRKILLGLLDVHNVEMDKQVLALRELDKLDKIGAAKVRELLSAEAIGLDGALIDTLLHLATLRGTHDEMLAEIAKLPTATDGDGQLASGFKDLSLTCAALKALGVPEKRTRLNLGIVRGLDYYTGTVYETLIDAHPEFGSVCSGGRYENLAGHYTKSKLPGVGISIGATRLFDVLDSIGWQGAKAATTTDLLVTVFDDSLLNESLGFAAQMRAGGLRADVMLDGGKMAKQMKYADRTGVRFVAMIGSDEQAAGEVTIKDMQSGEQQRMKRDAAVGYIKNIKAAG